MTINPPPPRFPAEGQTTASANPTATAASMALPPRLSTSTPTCDAIWLTEATIPLLPRTGGREAAREVGGKLIGDGAVISESSSVSERRSLANFFAVIKIVLF